MHAFSSHVAGIPCMVQVESVSVTQGTYSQRAETPDEYYGTQDVEFTILDRRGRAAPWLERKLTNQEISRIEEEIIEAAKQEAEDNY